MIGQEIALKYLIPLAIAELEKNLFAEGDFYPGDLLKSLLSVKKNFWKSFLTYWEDINNLIENRLSEIAEHKISTEEFYAARL